MAYQLPWGTAHPGLLIYLVDLSGSMAANDKLRRVSQTIWTVTDCLVADCQDMGVYKERFQLKVIGYNDRVTTLFEGGVNDINNVLDQHSDQLFFDVVNPTTKLSLAGGLTCTAMAFDTAAKLIERWRADNAGHRSLPAPMVIHITDGFPEESGLNTEQARNKALRAAQALKALAVDDGNVLLFNIHIDGKQGEGTPTFFPAQEPTDRRQQFLYQSASPMDEVFVERAKLAGMRSAQYGSHFMVSNIANARDLAQLVVFGSTVSSGICVPMDSVNVPMELSDEE